MKIHAITLRIIATLFVIIFGITQSITVLTADAGDTCSTNSDCDSGSCQASICIGKKIGQACSDDDQCTTGECENSFCVCDDQSEEKSAHCENVLYGGYEGTASGWKCMDSEQDPDSSRAKWNFCKKANYMQSLPKESTADVKYPVEKKILMGYACDDNDACLSQRGGYRVCDSTTIASTVGNDPWFAQDKQLKVCNLGTIVNLVNENLPQKVCTEQYGDGTWVKTEGIGELVNLYVCQNTAKNNWMPTTLKEMQSSVAPRDSNSVKTTFLGFDISTEAPELVTPETKIKIPGVFFSNITKETHITTDESGASWMNIPFLGEFISAMYKYSVGLISLIAVMVLIISGIQIITSAGNSEAISSAKHRIVSSVIAIIITAGSYTILYTVNPDLVNLKNLKILTVPGKPFDTEDIGLRTGEIASSESGTTPDPAEARTGPSVATQTSNCQNKPSQPSGLGDPQFLGQLDCHTNQERKETDIKYILLHDGGLTAQGTINSWKRECKEPGSCVGTHYFIERSGKTFQTMDDKKVAYHTPGWNSPSIGIDLAINGPVDRSAISCLQCKKTGKCLTYTGKPREAKKTDKATAIKECMRFFEPEQYESLKTLIQGLTARYNIPKNGVHVLGHCNSAGNHSDPAGFDWSKIAIAPTPHKKCLFDPEYKQRFLKSADEIFGP